MTAVVEAFNAFLAQVLFFVSSTLSFGLIGLLFFIGPALGAIAVRRSLSLRWHLFLLSICIFYGVVPLLMGWGGLALAEHFSCDVEITIYKCVGNPQLGNLITGMTFAPWGLMLTIPSSVLGTFGLLISFVLKVTRPNQGIQTSPRPTAAFYRSHRHQVIAGVCTAIAQRWHLPLLGVRIATVALLVIMPMLGLPLYLWLWLAFPFEPAAEST
ncbi:PspC domain-containing protein [Trichocoleus sp. FACHB-591]|uniref:PspC domain-containing protein n=1 Tax=Trichocoleus sp. FACHB-591 TaxID=2692872 RepID=UPI0016820FD1|nr:PspC domain-containing protein [Trichocoleus sp. FACHB-591]MBD2095264.1 PspC domain-containing protein [Trichocoleus sp. FACHB-591]